MSSSVGEETRPPLGWPFVAIWGGALLFVLIGFWVTVVALNATVYSGAGFVRGYVAAVDRGDTSSALTLAGVTPTDQLADALLEVPSLGGVDDVTEVGDVDLGDDRGEGAGQIRSRDHRGPARRAGGGAHRTTCAVVTCAVVSASATTRRL